MRWQARAGRVRPELPVAIEAKAQYDAVGDAPGENASMHALAVIHQDLGELDVALALITEELEALRQSGSWQSDAMSTETLAAIHRDRGEFDLAEQVAGEALTLAQELGDVRIECHLQATLGDALSGQGRHEDALDHFHLALSLAREVGAREVASARAALGDIDLALTDAQAAAQECENLQMAVHEAKVFTTLARIQHLAGRSPEAEQSALHAVHLINQSGAQLHLPPAIAILTIIQST
jgi:tetratricopeptide (TPR) repeat protein